MSEMLSLTLSEAELRRLREAVVQGRFPDEAAALRAGLEHVLGRGAEARVAIAEAYRCAYGRHPEQPWVGEAGARLMEEGIAELEHQGD